MNSADQDKKNRTRLKNLLVEYRTYMIDKITPKLEGLTESTIDAAIELITEAIK